MGDTVKTGGRLIDEVVEVMRGRAEYLTAGEIAGLAGRGVSSVASALLAHPHLFDRRARGYTGREYRLKPTDLVTPQPGGYNGGPTDRGEVASLLPPSLRHLLDRIAPAVAEAAALLASGAVTGEDYGRFVAGVFLPVTFPQENLRATGD